MGWFNNAEVDYLIKQVTNLTDRVQKLEADARYVADQPTSLYYSLFSQANPDINVVPINDVVKAIVKHLDMQIEKVAEQTTKVPQEVKVVEKPKVVMGATGVVTMPDGSGIPMPKAKRKYTKRKTK